MAPVVYLQYASPPVRAVLMTAKALNINLKEIEVSFFHNDHLKPEFQKVNPQHTIPTFIDDDGFGMWDSHAIMAYLVTKYGKNFDLYPSDVKTRALVDQRLFFESGAVFPHLNLIAKLILLQGNTSIDEKSRDGLIEAYGFLDKFLEGKKWVIGEQKTIADYSLIATVSSANGIIPVDPDLYPNVCKWLERAEKLPEYEANRRGLDESTKMLKIRLNRRSKF